jgi:exonuclease VII small subunit
MAKLNKYSQMFPDLKNQISRLERRRTDLDSTKENYEKIKLAKNLNSQKVQRAKQQVDEAQGIYNQMNKQLR